MGLGFLQDTISEECQEQCNQVNVRNCLVTAEFFRRNTRAASRKTGLENRSGQLPAECQGVSRKSVSTENQREAEKGTVARVRFNAKIAAFVVGRLFLGGQ